MTPPLCRAVALPDKGFTLVELLVAMLLGIVLSVGMVTAYLGTKQSAVYQDQLARMQENGRLAVWLLSREVVMAGFFAGLATPHTVTPATEIADCGLTKWVLNTALPLDHVDNHKRGITPVATSAGALSCLHGDQIKDGTDILLVQRTAAEPSFSLGSPAQRLGVSRVKSWYLRVQGGAPAGWEWHAPAGLGVAAASSPEADYWKGLSRIFYVRTFSNPHDKQADMPTLCVKTIAGNTMESRCLVEGIEDLQFDFGIDSNGDGVPDRYLDAPSQSQIRNAVTVRIHLLVRSIATISGWVDEKTYLLGRKHLAGRRDQYMRRVLSTTVLLHNRLRPASRQGLRL